MSTMHEEKIGRKIWTIHVHERKDSCNGQATGAMHYYCLSTFQGRASLKDTRHFRTLEEAKGYLDQVRAAQQHHDERKHAEKAKVAELKRAWSNPYQAGDLLHKSWGYEQTNNDFAQVSGVGPRSVTIRRIGKHTVAATGPMSSTVCPLKDRFPPDHELEVVRFTFCQCEGRLYAFLPSDYGNWNRVEPHRAYYESWYA
jgi:hypothetical protein